jgi:hypothetical protein
MNLNALTGEKQAEAAEAIGAFLRALHAIHSSSEVGFLLPREDERLVAEEYFARTQHEILSKLPPVEANALVKQFELYLSAPENFFFQPKAQTRRWICRFAHNSLFGAGAPS